MTTLQLFYAATCAGALLFFLAGIAVMAGRERVVVVKPVARAEPTTASGTIVDPSELARLRGALADSEALAAEQASHASDHATAAAQLRSELSATASRVSELEHELAERAIALRDLSTSNERLKGRLGDAEALRADYVRLRTQVTESDFLESEVARLEQELRTIKLEALGVPSTTQRRRPARGSTPGQPRNIASSLTTIIEDFADASSRGCAVADPLGFPLTSSGDDGVALAAYGALLAEAAGRAKQFLPLVDPASIEIVDRRGARVAVWTFDVEGDPLFLVNLAVAPVEPARVESALADLGAILAPSTRVDVRRA